MSGLGEQAGGMAARELDELLCSPSFVEDPYPAYARLREADAVHWCEPWQAWVVNSHDANIEVLRQPDAFSSAGYELAMLEAIERARPGAAASLVAHYSTQALSITDPPAHTRLRRLLVSNFTPRVVERLRPRVRELTASLLDDLPADGEVDILGGFAYPLPALVIGELLGVPPADRDRFMGWSADIVAFVGTGATDPARVDRAERSMAEFRESLRPLIADRRRRPSDDLLGSLAGASPDQGGLTDDELVATCVTLLFAGHETTANLIGNGLLALLRHPDQLRRLRERPDLAERAVEELLRFDSPVQRNRRRAARDVELAGRRIATGDRVLAFLGAANRDPAAFPHPDRLDIERSPGRHLAFGHGIHYCVGAALSRLEAPLALTAVLERFPRVGPAPGGTRWKPNIAFRGLEELRVRLDTSAPGAAPAS
ncbi:cytochrome P450 [soil metagenome]